MTTDVSLRVSADGNNALGDTLTRLATDAFHALGYEKFRLNVHKSGREIDLWGTHRLESRVVVAECKAQVKPVGGSDINKFVGALDAERRAAEDAELVGYFLSVSGFTQTAIEQERALSPSRVVLLDGSDLVDILVEGKIVSSPADAAVVAGRYVQAHEPNLKFLERMELVGSAIGWVWVLHFGKGVVTEAVCLVHADGEIFSAQLRDAAAEISPHRTILHDGIHDSKVEHLFLRKYKDFLSAEYGNITLEGLPADQQVGSRTFMLENLYVPLNLIDLERRRSSSKESRNRSLEERVDTNDPEIPEDEDESDVEEFADDKVGRGVKRASAPISEVLSKYDRVAILGPPGSGKTTILKRLCMAFSDLDRSHAADDSLPPYAAFPIIVRCRQLGATVKQSIGEILNAVATRAEMPQFSAEFRSYIGEQLRLGQVVLLIDGLDEIPSPADRAAFVAQLRTFVGQYPKIRIVVTSREVGFRIIAGTVGTICRTFRVDELSDDSIKLLSQRWHREVLGNRRQVEEEATALADSIVSTDRVRRLAVNPLLLTTLLLVRRWIGQLPRRRTVLYQKAIEVLLMTWNVESHDPIDPEEALPQLSYAAYMMMVDGQASVTSAELAALFTEARKSVPEVLAYAKMSVHDFLERVEERSSLLVRSGQKLENGVLQWVYEFKHLTFQEYLCALALVNGHLPEGVRQRDPARLLGVRVKDPRWREVVALTAVLSGRNASKILAHLKDSAVKIERQLEGLSQRPSKGRSTRPRDRREIELSSILENIVACLSDEVPIAPEDVASAIKFVVERNEQRRTRRRYSRGLASGLLGGRYEEILRKTLESELPSCGREHYPSYLLVLADVVVADAPDGDYSGVKEYLEALLASEHYIDLVGGIILVMILAFKLRVPENDVPLPDPLEEDVARYATKIARDLCSEEGSSEELTFARIWALAWSIHLLHENVELTNSVQEKLFIIWYHNPEAEISNFAAWALQNSPIVGAWNLPEFYEDNTVAQFAKSFFDRESSGRVPANRAAALISSYYLNLFEVEWIASSAADFYKKTLHAPFDRSRIQQLVEVLGESALLRLREMKEEDEEDADEEG